MLAALSQSEVDTTNQLSYTENGAIGYKTSGKELLDINFAISSMRNMNEEDIRKIFKNCRRVLAKEDFRICLELLSQNHIDIARAVLSLVPEYGRWDDLFGLMKGNLQDDVFKIVKNQLKKDKINMNENKSISLCAKWMPSGNILQKKQDN
ncbi:hypothetical protein LY90DRAFT_520081 [Neocallimastix californiae]|uniref:Uncharacterized protein n=1 Tax=Neocallimastix californiae TaxID=1754190 RepID=A0A1Y1YHE3_9FUNG|nr:hypothetical protein LY90DRAFT_520081 [Neocallimastix californiae]|eukprot:ORX97432.1 hypothetical protein LY90DRAFT_520081 [Neocallimastix californiae]